MVSAFTAFEAAASAAVDAVHGERLRFTPRAKGFNGGKIADADRVVVECVATFLGGGSKLSFTDGDLRNSGFNAPVSAQHSFATVDRARFVAGKEPRAGDIVETIDQDPVRRFEIVDVYPHGARWALPLVPV